jgi:multiple sugar transport system ATP-binding protein
MIYVTHDQVEAMTLATRIVVMLDGVVQQIGSPAQVYDRPANRFVAGFLGSPSMNFIAGDIDGHGNFSAGLLTLTLADGALGARSAVLGVRPEDIHIDAAGLLNGVVALVEPMGNHQVVWIACGTHLLSATVQGTQSFIPGQPIRFAIDLARISLFDVDSGVRL